MQHSTESASFHTISSHFWQIAPALLLRNLLFPDAWQDLQKFLQPDLELELDFAFCFLTFSPEPEMRETVSKILRMQLKSLIKCSMLQEYLDLTLTLNQPN